MGADNSIALLHMGRLRLREFKLFGPTVSESYIRQTSARRCVSGRALAVRHGAPHHNVAFPTLFPNMVITSSAGFKNGQKLDSINIMILKALEKHLLHVGNKTVSQIFFLLSLFSLIF